MNPWLENTRWLRYTLLILGSLGGVLLFLLLVVVLGLPVVGLPVRLLLALLVSSTLLCPWPWILLWPSLLLLV